MADANYIPDDRIISRKQAKALGLTRYFPGSKCKHGHITERLVINGSCCECSRLKQIDRYRTNPEDDLRRQKEWRESNRWYIAERKARKYANDPELAARVATRNGDKSACDLALKNGESKYLSPRICKTCGTAERFAKDGKCVECNRRACAARNEARMLADPEKWATREKRKEELISAAERRALREAELVPYRMTKAARAEAIRTGAKFYKSYKPCSKGHIGMRYTKHGSCVQCAAIQSASLKKKEYDKEYLKKNYEKIKKRVTVYRHANKSVFAEKSKAWSLKNPEKRKAISENYKHKRRAQEESGIASAELLAWKKAQKKICYWCGAKCPKKYHVDHYTPLSKGGKHEVENLVIACPTCNLTKSAKDPYDFAAEVGRLF